QQPQHELPDQPPGLTPAETSRDPGHHRVQETRPALIIGMRYRAPDGRRVLYSCHTKQRSRRPSRMSGTPPDRDHPRPPRRPAATSPQPRSTAAVSEIHPTSRRQDALEYVLLPLSVRQLERMPRPQGVRVTDDQRP